MLHMCVHFIFWQRSPDPSRVFYLRCLLWPQHCVPNERGCIFELTARMKLFQSLSLLFNSALTSTVTLGKPQKAKCSRAQYQPPEPDQNVSAIHTAKLTWFGRSPASCSFECLPKSITREILTWVSENPRAGEGPKPSKAPLYYLNVPRGFISPFPKLAKGCTQPEGIHLA